MIELYLSDTCPYCTRVHQFMEVNDVPYVTKPVLRGMFTDSGFGEELRKRGGKVQVPYLVDPERDVEMYESEDIIAYIQEHYVGNR